MDTSVQCPVDKPGMHTERAILLSGFCIRSHCTGFELSVLKGKSKDDWRIRCRPALQADGIHR